MFTRALSAFLVMPGMVACVIPLVWLWHDNQLHIVYPLGLIILVLGCMALLWCVRDFYVWGKGTLAPWAPPRRLVIVGLYRYSRNPMYVSVILVLLGWAMTFGSMKLFGYTVVVFVAFHLRVVFGEEPWLAQTHGDAWVQYVQRVPRWFW